jgi:hypothetical protein
MPLQAYREKRVEATLGNFKTASSKLYIIPLRAKPRAKAEVWFGWWLTDMVSDHRQSQKTERGGGRSLAAQDVGFICHNAKGRKKAIFCHCIITTEKKCLQRNDT